MGSNRRRTPRAVALAVAAAAAAGTSLLLLHPGSAGADPNTRKTLIASAPVTSALFHPCAACFEYTQPAGAHIGGVEIDTGTLTDYTGRVVGHYALQSVGVTPFGPDGPGEVEQTATLVIGNSQLTTQGIEEPPLNGGVAAITGGTGRFAGIRGQIDYTDNADGTTTLVVELI